MPETPPPNCAPIAIAVSLALGASNCTPSVLPAAKGSTPLTFDNVCAQLRCSWHCGRTFKRFQAFLSHVCGYQPCYNCGATVDVWDHKCYIQNVPNRRGPKRKHPTTTSTATQSGPGPEEQTVV